MDEAVVEMRAKPSDSSSRGAPLTIKDFKGKAEPDWCPGCGDFGVLSALKMALAELGIRPHEAMVISGIGCSSNLPGYISTYGMHTLHGRALSVATGAQMANHELKIIITGGDGDGYGIGGNHFVHKHAPQCGPDVHRDEQSDLRSHDQAGVADRRQGMQTKSTPSGSVENPIMPIPLAIAAGATYVARAYTGQVKHMVELIKGGIEHKGFALIDALSLA
jgi:2-oxoglutarate ferredoxin oxidoreductase subunit beta